MPTLISTIKRRVDPSGVREVVIRPYGVRQVEVIIPEVSEAEIETIKKDIADTGSLKFRIVANRDRDKETWDAGELALAPKMNRSRTISSSASVTKSWEMGRPGTHGIGRRSDGRLSHSARRAC